MKMAFVCTLKDEIPGLESNFRQLCGWVIIKFEKIKIYFNKNMYMFRVERLLKIILFLLLVSQNKTHVATKIMIIYIYFVLFPALNSMFSMKPVMPG